MLSFGELEVDILPDPGVVEMQAMRSRRDFATFRLALKKSGERLTI
jgi:hypothetical protein